jgi:epoxyqueuosine reductase QueG
MSLLSDLRQALEPYGLNHLGVADPAAYDAVARPELRASVLHPGTRSVIVVGSGGSALWEAFLADLRRDPTGLTHQAHPLDHFVAKGLAAAEPVLAGTAHRWIQVAANAPLHLDMRTLSVQAGLGAPSRLGLVLDARYGPWLGLRGACFLDAELPPSPPAPDLCEGCAAPCMGACPGGAFVDGRWDVGRCATFHQVSDRCHGICHARLACPVGVAERYPELERRYHDDRAKGRAMLRKHLGIRPEDDRHAGVGPHWDAWA